jgi:3-(3-hydroxy-phenyl)propionate hydroxylase
MPVFALNDPKLASFRDKLDAWLDTQDVDAVLVRTDRYIFDIGKAAELAAAYQRALT